MSEPAMVTVLSYRVFNPLAAPAGWEVPVGKRTAQQIASFPLAEAIEGTSELVPASTLDEEGRYLPPGTKLPPTRRRRRRKKP